MASTPKPRMQALQVQANIDAFLALKVMPGYKSYNDAFALDVVTAGHDQLRAAQEAELHAQHALSAARDALVTAQWRFQDLILGVKEQVRAIYGPDSDEIVQLGLKKKSEKKARSRGSKLTGSD